LAPLRHLPRAKKRHGLLIFPLLPPPPPPNGDGAGATPPNGDGAGAAILQRTEEEGSGILTTRIHSDGTYAERLAILAPSSHEREFSNQAQLDEGRTSVVMNGRFVFKMAVEKFPEVINEALEATGYGTDDLDLFIPHQANLRIAEAVRRRLGLPEDKVYNNIMWYGNTTSATIPIAMAEAQEKGLLKEGDLLCVAAFGSGFTWASALIRM